MNNNNTNIFKHQSGNATLAMSLVLLAVVTVVGTTSSKTATNEIRMTTNSIEKQKSQIAAESTILQAWNTVNTFTKMDFLESCNRPGVYDLRSTAASKQCTLVNQSNTKVIQAFTNKRDAWEISKNPANWDWAGNNASQHKELASKLAISTAQILSVSEKTDPMKLFKKPQYAIAIHEPVYRAGSAQICFPISIIGAAKGGVEETETLIEIRAIPANGCFANLN